MSKNKKKKITIEPVGYSAEKVTGSCNLIKYNETTIAVEIGGIQEGHTILQNYNMNKSMLQKIKPQKLNYIFVGHLHYDHIGNICAMYKNNKCDATIIVPKGSTSILKEMWKDSAKISQRDCDHLNRKSNKMYEPIYNENDIEIALDHIEEYESNQVFELTDELSFRFTPGGHIMLSQQIELFIKLNNHTSKILITSDLGNLTTQDKRIFVEDFSPVPKATVVLGESTYGLRDKRNTKKDLEKDLEKIKTIITQYCVDNNHRILFPTFSLDKTPIMLWYFYQLFGKDKNFKVPIIVDSPLAIRLIKHYSNILEGEQKEKFDELMSWKNLKFIINHEDSMAAMKDKNAKVIVSSGGMLQSGRAVSWAQEIIPKTNDMICFCGYCGENTIGYKLRNSKSHKTITVNNKILKNNCQVASLLSFSSHMQHQDLVNYYKSIQSEHIYLLHGDFEARKELKEDLQVELANMCKTTKVSIITKGMKISV